jgi:hypothetical protein
VAKKFLIVSIFSFLFLGMFSNGDAFYLDFQPRVGYLLPTAKSGKRLFSGAPLAYQLEASAHFAYVWDDIPWKVWLNTTWVPGTGHYSRDKDDRDDNLRHFHTDHEHHRGHRRPFFKPKVVTNWIPTSLGLKYSWNLCGFGDVYLGIGPSFSYIRVRVRNDFFQRKFIKKEFGGVFKSGLRFTLCNWILVDLFADYHITSFGDRKRHCDFFELNTPDLNMVDHHRRGHRQLNINSFMTGGGIGFAF